ncbi:MULTISPECIES: copper chaperone PCu(A)C [Streptomyces]|jgi:copper(I)-binding protein|uniref:copper chaperone PCu(A)C n=1 Tax=Streptomyces TaxID=1883 RepID=UPI0019042F5E|nr:MULTISPECIES: copper chaperone PCu(A)C [unclassified Streptomyces]MCU4746392.1 copper chaperone PCu(A)C [Streptomyces sp. G-5]QQN76677.1 copper chaperone PCu(A)C [Streptomyces sp. XC 2026]
MNPHPTDEAIAAPQGARSSLPFRWTGALRAALVPLAAGSLTLLCLILWTGTGRAGSPAEIEVAEGRVFLPILDTQDTTGVFFEVTNTGGSDEQLLEVSTERGRAMFSDRELTTGAGRMIMIPRITVPADSTLDMSPFTPNVMLSPDLPLIEGERIDFVLRFRQSGEIPVSAVVVPPGS